MEQLNIGTFPLEESLTALENAKHALVTPSGMSAIQIVLQTLLAPGDHILVNEDMYSGTLKLLRTLYVDMDIKCDKIDMSDLDIAQESITAKTRIVLLESPSNPMMRICDIEAIINIVRTVNKNTLVVVDNSIMTNLLQSPLDLGADIVLYSLTEYINGHQDIVMGSIVTNNSDIFGKLKVTRHWNGFIPSNWDCTMVQRGLKTLKIRLAKHESSAMKVADFLKSSPHVEEIFWVGLQKDNLQSQIKGSNGIISFRLKGDVEFAKNVLKTLRIIIVGESYASCESLICIPFVFFYLFFAFNVIFFCFFRALMTHNSVPRKDRLHVGMTDNLIRLSVGLEDPQDLINDLENAFRQSVY